MWRVDGELRLGGQRPVSFYLRDHRRRPITRAYPSDAAPSFSSRTLDSNRMELFGARQEFRTPPRTRRALISPNRTTWRKGRVRRASEIAWIREKNRRFVTSDPSIRDVSRRFFPISIRSPSLGSFYGSHDAHFMAVAILSSAFIFLYKSASSKVVQGELLSRQ